MAVNDSTSRTTTSPSKRSSYGLKLNFPSKSHCRRSSVHKASLPKLTPPKHPADPPPAARGPSLVALLANAYGLRRASNAFRQHDDGFDDPVTCAVLANVPYGHFGWLTGRSEAKLAARRVLGEAKEVRALGEGCRMCRAMGSWCIFSEGSSVCVVCTAHGCGPGRCHVPAKRGRMNGDGGHEGEDGLHKKAKV